MKKYHKESVESFLLSGDVDGARNWAVQLPKEDKFIFAPIILKELKKFYEYDSGYSFTNSEGIDRNLRAEVLKVCFFATTGLSLLKKSPWYSTPDTVQIIEILRVTKPDWVDNWVNWSLESSPRSYRIVKPLLEQGLCEYPIHDNYILGLIECFVYDFSKEQTLYEALKSSPQFFKKELWQFFEIEGGGEFSLAARDKYSHEHNTWAYNLRLLANEGVISRDKLMDSALSALGKDFAQFRASWFSRFFNSLEPTLEELERRQDSLLFLLGSHIKPTVSFALKHIQLLERKKYLNSTAFLDASEPLFSSETKSTVIGAFKVLESIFKRRTDVNSHIPYSVLKAFYLENSDVQAKAFDVIDKYNLNKDDAFKTELMQLTDFILPSLKGRLPADIPGADSNNSMNGVNEELLWVPESSVFQIKSVDNIYELLDLISILIETPEDPIAIEKMLDGFYRFPMHGDSEIEKRLAPILKRVKQIISRGLNNWMQFYISLTVLSLLEKQNHLQATYLESFSSEEPEIADAFIARLFHLIDEVTKNEGTAVSICLPSDSQGFINPREIVDRLTLISHSDFNPPVIELSLTILRFGVHLLTEQESTKTITRLLAIESEFADACAYALGANVKIGITDALWIAAARIRVPNEEDKDVTAKFGNLGADASIPAKYETWVHVKKTENYTFSDLRLNVTPLSPKNIPYEHWAVLFHRTKETNYYDKAHFGYDTALVKWGSTIYPSNLESYFACGAAELDITWAEAQWHVQSFFEPLLEASVPFGEMARLLLIAGLSSKEQGQRGITLDILIGAMQDGRFKFEEFGSQMSSLITSTLIVVSRWTKALKEVSEASDNHARQIHSLIQSLLKFSPQDSPRELGGLLELLYELSIRLNQVVSDPSAIEFFKLNKKGGKQKKYCSSLLVLTEIHTE